MIVEFVEAIIQFYTPEQGGRKTSLTIDSLKYMPHFRISDDSDLLGVRFVGGPSEINPGDTAKVQVHLTYPQVCYDDLIVEQKFYLCEGPFPIGEGKVMQRWVEEIEPQEIRFRLIDQSDI